MQCLICLNRSKNLKLNFQPPSAVFREMHKRLFLKSLHSFLDNKENPSKGFVRHWFPPQGQRTMTSYLLWLLQSTFLWGRLLKVVENLILTFFRSVSNSFSRILIMRTDRSNSFVFILHKHFSRLSNFDFQIQQHSSKVIYCLKKIQSIFWLIFNNKLIFDSPFLHLHSSLQPKRQGN